MAAEEAEPVAAGDSHKVRGLGTQVCAAGVGVGCELLVSEQKASTTIAYGRNGDDHWMMPARLGQGRAGDGFLSNATFLHQNGTHLQPSPKGGR